MALSDVFSSRLSRPAGRVLDAPIREIVHELLKEHGYASPAEVQAIRDEVKDMRTRMDGMEKRLADLQHLAEQARTEANMARQAAEASPAPSAGGHESRIGHLEARISELEAALADGSHAAPGQVAPLVAAPRGNCKVAGCADTIRSKGFCSAHYQQWRRGSLKGFGSPDAR